ncbi:MAG: DJ-1/PfpI family protein [Alphaproteobacteria bacterium]|nr:DJ-1/PfpI family protein [Alphaproteobacteria bacterium]
MAEESLNIVFVLYPNLTQLDFTGPLQVLSRLPGASVHLAAKTLEPVSTDAVLTIPPTVTFADCPPADVLCIPGGFGVDDAINDAALMDFVKREGARAKYVTSVCTGAFVLGAAGLLKGKRATTHWAFHSALEEVGAIPVRERVVRDGNIFTGGGVTAGIDFAFTLAAEIAGEAFASSLQLGIEYDPAPPFEAGSPDKAPAEVLTLVEAFYAPPLEAFRAALARSMDNS